MVSSVINAMAWLILILSFIFLGSALSALGISLGLLHLLGLNYDEWFVVFSPTYTLLALVLGLVAALFLRKKVSTPRLFAVSLVVVALSFGFCTWQFMAFAT
jgi:amino acid permease